MTKSRFVALVAGALVLCTQAIAQIVPTGQERSVLTTAELGNGTSDGNFVDSPDFGPFAQSISTQLTGPGGAVADSFASQTSSISSSAVSGTLASSINVVTGSTFVTAQGRGRSNFLLLFSLSQASPVEFIAGGSIVLRGVNPNGDPSDLYGRASVRLLNADTEDQIAGFTLFPSAGSDSASFSGTLPAGSYALLATAESFGFSPDLLGPPVRSGSGQAQVNFSLTVPAPASAVLVGLGGLLAVRRRR
jgi:hypothetical protein